MPPSGLLRALSAERLLDVVLAEHEWQELVRGVVRDNHPPVDAIANVPAVAGGTRAAAFRD
jgi:hypothetical protein